MTCLVTYKIFIIKKFSFFSSFLPQIYVIVYSHEDEKKILIFNARKKKMKFIKWKFYQFFLQTQLFFPSSFLCFDIRDNKRKAISNFSFPLFPSIYCLFSNSQSHKKNSFSFQSHFPINFFSLCIVIICYPLSRHIL